MNRIVCLVSIWAICGFGFGTVQGQTFFTGAAAAWSNSFHEWELYTGEEGEIGYAYRHLAQQ